MSSEKLYELFGAFLSASTPLADQMNTDGVSHLNSYITLPNGRIATVNIELNEGVNHG